jgi:hypothetical protein
VAADENQIRQALLNLVRNAKEAMTGGGRLRVAVAPRAPGRVSISVADTRRGIPAEHLGKIFDAFFSTKEKGTGLGLALVQQIAAEHGGRIEVSSPPDGGTTFVLTLNALPRPANASSSALGEESGESPVRAAGAGPAQRGHAVVIYGSAGGGLPVARTRWRAARLRSPSFS